MAEILATLKCNRMPLELQKDGQLLEAVRTGDESALRELLERHAPSVFRFALKMCRQRVDAEDVAQETLLAAVRGAKSVRATTSFTTWLYVVARSFCIKMRRRRKERPGRDSSADEAATAAPSGLSAPDDEAAAREMISALDAAIGNLDDEYREVIVLRDVEGLSAAEVADVLGISVDAVKSRLHRARSEVRAKLGAPVSAAGAVAARRDVPCAEIGTTFSKYLEGEIGPEACAVMQRHVEGCTSCSAVCEGLRKSVSLCRQAGQAQLSERDQMQVRRALEKALGAARPAAVNRHRAKS
jgi:RNA polymerase sigma-70 factor, ECF subfamily